MDILTLKKEFEGQVRTWKRLLDAAKDLDESTSRRGLDPETRFVFNQLMVGAEYLSDAHRVISRLGAPVTREGVIQKQSNGRYEFDGYEITSGTPIEVFLPDEDEVGGGVWIASRVEHDGDDYCLVDDKTPLNGLRARLRPTW